ncbi:MAG: TetR family transcriptional regulator [Actinobacteria bacterium]|nr:TetR family transcriptional regulator [Actinomycetota bacterium]
MPIQVDHERQRERVTLLAARLVAQEGVAALTFRRVAEAAGTSTAIVSTYFADKRDLLLSTLRAAASRTTVRFEAAMNAGAGLQECLEAWLPLDEDRLADWRVIIAFWGAAVADPELARVQDGHSSRARTRIEMLLRDERRPGGEPPPDPARLAQQILALTLGIAVQAVFEPAVPPSLPQRALLSGGLARLAPGAADVSRRT